MSCEEACTLAQSLLVAQNLIKVNQFVDLELLMVLSSVQSALWLGAIVFETKLRDLR